MENIQVCGWTLFMCVCVRVCMFFTFHLNFFSLSGFCVSKVINIIREFQLTPNTTHAWDNPKQQMNPYVFTHLLPFSQSQYYGVELNPCGCKVLV